MAPRPPSRGYRRLIKALQMLADACDGALTIDGAGFNKLDTIFGHDLARKSEYGPLSAAQTAAAWKMLRKYTSQLRDVGLELPSRAPKAPEPETPARTRLKLQDGKIQVIFPGRPPPTELKALKGLPDRRWHHEKQNSWWEVPARLLPEALAALPEAEIDQALLDLKTKQEELATLGRQSESRFEVPGLKGELLPFQRAGVEFLERSGGRAILADEMGLGKTVQALAYLQLHAGERPAFIVVPAGLKINWQREAEKWLDTGDHIELLSGTKARRLKTTANTIFILNYDILKAWQAAIAACHPRIIIFDEAHYLKNRRTQRGGVAQELAQSAPSIISLTGTPVTNRPLELFPLLHLTAPGAWDNFFRYALRYCDAKRTPYGWDFSGASNLEELHAKTRPWVVRRTKAQVLAELPEKRRAPLIVEFDEKERRRYDEALAGLVELVKNSRARKESLGAPHLAAIEKAKQAAVYAKLPAALNWMAQFLDTGNKLAVFATHQFTIEAVMTRFGGQAVMVTGAVTGKARQKAVDAFQNEDGVRLFAGNIKAAGVGLTLTAASDVAFLEFPWAPGDLEQAADRVHRIGQRNSVTMWLIAANGTIDEDIVELLERKRKVVEMVHEGRVSGNEISMAGELIGRAIKEQGD